MTNGTIAMERVKPASAKPRRGSRTTGAAAWRRRAWLVLIFLIVVSGCKEKQTTAAPAAPLAVVAVKAVARDVPLYRTYPATTQSPAVVQVDARVKGYLEERLFAEGQDVEAGRLLYRIQPDQFAAQVVQAEADVEIARTNLRFARTEYDRNEPLSKTGAISKQEWDRYARSLADAEGKLAAAEANLVEAALNLSYTQVEAPIAGRIGATRVDVGNLVGPATPDGQPLATIVRLDPMRVVFQPAADEYPAFAEARARGEVAVHITIPQRTGDPLVFDGAIDLLNNTAQPTTSTFIARAVFPSPKKLVLPEQYASARVKLATLPGAVLVPTDALFETPTKHFLYVVKPDDSIERRDVELGGRFDGFTRIASGLKADETVIVSASPLILKGVDKVKPHVVDADAYLKGKADHAASTSTGSSGGTGS